MARHPRRRRTVRTRRRLSSARRTHSATGRTLRPAAAADQHRSRDPCDSRGRTPQEDGSGMGLKPDYKQTEVGAIPKDWEVRTLGELTTLLTNGFVGTATSAYV